jgi:predicted AAA+ superfamily ATPase
MTLTPEGYLPRLADKTLERYLRLFGAVAVEGPKWCGKTWTSLAHSQSSVSIMDPENGYANREAARLNPAAILEGNEPGKDPPLPLLVDEWQEVPAIWDAVRFACDKTREKGRYIITGSSTPKDDSYIHSGAGRIARLRMRPMSLKESGVSSCAASLSALFEGQGVGTGASRLNQNKLISLLTRGGWPGNLETADNDAGILPLQYIQTLAESDISHSDNKRRNPDLILQLLASLARLTAGTAQSKPVVSDVQARFGDVTRQTVAAYTESLKRLYVIDEIPEWFPELKNTLRLRRLPKRIFCDPSLAIAALHARPAELKRDPRTLGNFFENLALRDLEIYAESIGGKLSHYHDSGGLEVDAILEKGNQWAAIEVKLGSYRVEEGEANIKKLCQKVESKGAPPPSFSAVVTGGGPLYQIKNGPYVIPLDFLAP